jgi:hypothetical protein
MDRSFLQKTDLENLDAAKRWIRRLVDAGLDFHFEDDPYQLIDGAGRRVFNDYEAATIMVQVRHMYAMDWGKFECPIGYELHCMEQRDGSA